MDATLYWAHQFTYTHKSHHQKTAWTYKGTSPDPAEQWADKK